MSGEKKEATICKACGGRGFGRDREGHRFICRHCIGGYYFG